jgi:hypothetical protein
MMANIVEQSGGRSQAFDCPFVGRGWITTGQDGGEQLLAKQLPAIGEEMLSFIVKRSKLFGSPEFFELVKELPATDKAGSAVLCFEQGGKSLASLLGKNQLLASPDCLQRLIRTLAQAGRRLESASDYHPALSLGNVFLKDGSFRLVNPYLYDCHATEMKDLLHHLLGRQNQRSGFDAAVFRLLRRCDGEQRACINEVGECCCMYQSQAVEKHRKIGDLGDSLWLVSG